MKKMFHFCGQLFRNQKGRKFTKTMMATKKDEVCSYCRSGQMPSINFKTDLIVFQIFQKKFRQPLGLIQKAS